MLRIEKLSKSFGKRKILSNISLSINKGEIVTLVGPNGAGKTTLFNILSGFMKAEAGAIIFKDRRIDYLSPLSINEIGIARTFQNLRLIRNMTVADNILLAFKGNRAENILNALLPASFYDNNTIEFGNKAKILIQKLFLEDVTNSYAGDISYGQQKLLTLGCCLANDPDFFLLDEPVSGVNPNYKEKLISLLKTLKDEKKTVFLIEHNSDFIEAVSDKLFFLSGGRVHEFSDYSHLKNSQHVQEAYL